MINFTPLMFLSVVYVIYMVIKIKQIELCTYEILEIFRFYSRTIEVSYFLSAHVTLTFGTRHQSFACRANKAGRGTS